MMHFAHCFPVMALFIWLRIEPNVKKRKQMYYLESTWMISQGQFIFNDWFFKQNTLYFDSMRYIWVSKHFRLNQPYVCEKVTHKQWTFIFEIFKIWVWKRLKKIDGEEWCRNMVMKWNIWIPKVQTTWKITDKEKNKIYPPWQCLCIISRFGAEMLISMEYMYMINSEYIMNWLAAAE